MPVDMPAADHLSALPTLTPHDSARSVVDVDFGNEISRQIAEVRRELVNNFL